MADGGYRTRLVDGLIDELLGELPALMITGPRASGKTTTAQRHSGDVVRLDRAAEASVFRADPDAALELRKEPVLLDEWQEVPEVLGAVKRAVDREPRPGRFILTGSVRAELDTPSWPGTGRLVRLPMYGMTVRELVGRAPSRPFLDRLASDEQPSAAPDSPDVRGYMQLALGSGFPEPAIHLGSRATIRWLGGYVDQLLTRDASAVAPGRDSGRLRRYFEAYALNTAGTVADTTLSEAAGITRRTALGYERLLSDLYVVDPTPAWTSNRLKRLSLGAKRHVVDPALAAAVLGLDLGALLRDGDMLGRVLESFVMAQLRSELPVCETRPRLYHLREEHGRHEVDIVVELGGRDVIACEVKADAAPGREDARHLIWCRDRLGERFLRGVLFHTGPGAYELDERIAALPISALWG